MSCGYVRVLYVNVLARLVRRSSSIASSTRRTRPSSGPDRADPARRQRAARPTSARRRQVERADRPSIDAIAAPS